MKAAITVLTTAITMTALAVPYRGAPDSNRTRTDTTLMPTLLMPTPTIPTINLLLPDTTLVTRPSGKHLRPSASAEAVQLDSMNKVFVTLTPAASPSPNSTATDKKSSSENKDGKKVHILGSLMNSLGLDGFMGSLNSLISSE